MSHMQEVVATDSKEELACLNSQGKFKENTVWQTVGAATTVENQSFTLTEDEDIVARELDLIAGVNQGEGRQLRKISMAEEEDAEPELQHGEDLFGQRRWRECLLKIFRKEGEMPEQQLGVLLERVLKQQAEVLPAEEQNFYCCREGMDDRVANRAAVRTEEIRMQQTKVSVQKSEEILDREIELIRKLMQKMPQKRTAARKLRISSSKRKIVTDCEGIESAKMQTKIWKPGGMQKKNATTNN